MRLLRKLLINFLLLITTISFVALAVSVSFSSAFYQSNKLKVWARQSNFYSSVINKANSDTIEALNRLSIMPKLDVFVGQTLPNVLPESQFNDYLDSIINNNYAWLKGQITIPNFSVNLSGEKASLAKSIGEYAGNQYNELPVCSVQQIKNLESSNYINPLRSSCKLPAVSQASVQSLVTQQVSQSHVFSSNNSFTATNFKRPNSNKPYYSGIDGHKIYNLLWQIPVALVIIIVICLAIVLALARKQKTSKVWPLIISLAIAGLILTLTSASIKVEKNQYYSRISHQVFRTIGQNDFTAPITKLIYTICNYVGERNLLIGIVYLAISVILALILVLRSKNKHIKSHFTKPQPNSVSPSQAADDQLLLSPSRHQLQSAGINRDTDQTNTHRVSAVAPELRPPLSTDITLAKPSKRQPTAPLIKARPSNSRPRRLIQ